MILCDTNILIEFYKGNPDLTNVLQAVGVRDLAISVVTTGELFNGAKDRRELHKLHKP